MPSMAEFAKQAEKFTVDNSPMILTAVGTAGIITTGVLSFKAGIKVSKVLQNERVTRWEHEEDLELPSDVKIPLKEQFALTWKHFLPPAASVALTCGAVISANQIGTKRTAALAAAYSLSEKAFTEYREAVVEKLGEKKEAAARDDAAQNRVNRTPLGDREVVIVGDGSQIAFDSYSGRYFKSSTEEIKHAINRVNHQIINEGYASLTDFYHALGLRATSESEEVGWTSETLLDVHITTTLTDKGEPALALDYRVMPVRNYFRIH